MIGHDLSNFKKLQHYVNVISDKEKTVCGKIQQHYRPKMVSAKAKTICSLAQVVEPMMDPVRLW